MNTSNLAQENPSPRCNLNKHQHVALAAFIGAWGAIILYLIFIGAMQNEPGRAPIGIIIANGVPIGGFFVLYAFSSSLRTYVQTFDPSLLAGLHAMRTIGFSFLAFATYGELPWLFAIPAGLGDIAVAITAPYIAYFAATRSGFIRSNRFMIWNIFGVIDFIVAVGIGALSTALGAEIVGAGMVPMGTLPMIIIPAFLVPLLMITHIIMIMGALQARKKLT